jgi:hypothetical protein
LDTLAYILPTDTRTPWNRSSRAPRAYVTLSALAGRALTEAKSVGPFSAGLLRRGDRSYTAVMAAVLVICAVAGSPVPARGVQLTPKAATSRERR